MLTNDELKKKIAQIIAEYCCPLGKTHKQLYGDERQCYSEMNFAECKPITESTNALIAAGIGDVKDLQVQVDSLEITNIALQAGYDDAEKDRLYWVNKYKEAEHRAEVAEKAFDDLADEIYQHDVRPICDKEFFKQARFEQAEKELAEEKKE